MRFGWLTVVVVSILAAALGALGHYLASASHNHSHTSLDDFVHQRIALTPEEQERILPVETTYHQTHNQIEQDIRAANVELARALRSGDAAAIEAALSQTKSELTKLQDLTVRHIMAMREALDESHRAAFDEAVTLALAHGGI